MKRVKFKGHIVVVEQIKPERQSLEAVMRENYSKSARDIQRAKGARAKVVTIIDGRLEAGIRKTTKRFHQLRIKRK